MARVKITEYRAKRLLLGDAYAGLSFDEKGTTFPTKGSFVVKVDQGIKKRFVQGLVALSVPARDIQKVTAPWKKKGFSRFLAEPFFPHTKEEEKYLSLERVRDGVRVLYTREGGIDIESHPEAISTFTIATEADAIAVAQKIDIPETFFIQLYTAFQKYHCAFVEINPLVVRGAQVHLLDAAVLVDSAGMPFVRSAWTEEDIVEAGARHATEEKIHALARTTSASLSLKVLNPNGNIFFLLSGGGGSIVIADEAAEKGMSGRIGNYGEYSGGPTREETHLYAREIISLMLSSTAKKKALVIAGGIANFTNIKTTFAGIIDALTERMKDLQKQKIKVYVRRGGPEERAGLEHMQAYLKTHGVLGAVYGSDAPITSAVDDAVRFVAK